MKLSLPLFPLLLWLTFLGLTFTLQAQQQEAPAAGTKDKAPVTAPELEISNEAQAMNLLASKAFAEGDWAQAVLAYQQVLQSNPENPLVRSNLGQALFRQGEFARAAQELEQALALKPDLLSTWLALGMSYQNLERPYAAISAFSRAVDLNPESAVAHQLLGVALHRNRWTNAARLQMQEALRLDPSFSAAHYNLAVTYLDVSPPSPPLAARHYEYSLQTGGARDEEFEARIERLRATSTSSTTSETEAGNE